MNTLKLNHRFDQFIQVLPIIVLGSLALFEELGFINLCKNCVGFFEFFDKGIMFSIYLFASFFLYLIIYGVAQLVALWRGKISKINVVSFVFLFIAVILTTDVELTFF